ncbi:MAG: PAS domain S-box protein [bacterium]
MLDPQPYALTWTALARLSTVLYIAVFAAWGFSFNHRSRTNQTFFLMAICAVLWNLGAGLMFLSLEQSTAEKWYRLSHFGVVFLPPGVLLFTSALTHRLRKNRKWILAGYVMALAWALDALFGHFVIQDMWKARWGFYPRFGMGGVPFIGFFSLCLALAFRTLLQGVPAAAFHVQKRYVRLAALTFVPTCLGSWDFLPAFGVGVYPFGFMSIVFFVTFFWWLDYRYQLLNPSPERLARNVLSTVGEAILAVDGAGFVRMSNHATRKLLGYEKGELLGKPLKVLLDPQDRELLTSFLQGRRGAEAGPENFLVTLLAKDGTPIRTACSLSLIRGWRGGVLGAVLACRDIRDRLRKEEELRQSERRFRSLIEHSSDLVTVLDARGTARYQGQSFQLIMGYKPDAMIGNNPFELVHQEDAGPVLEKFLRILEKPGSSMVAEYRFRHGDGTWRTLESIARNLLDDPAVGGIVVNSRDITERKKVEEELRRHRDHLRELVEERTAVLQGTMEQLRQEMAERLRVEAELRQSEARFRSLVQNSSDVIVIFEPDGRRRYVSPSVERVLGYTAEELMGGRYTDLVHFEDVGQVQATFQWATENPNSPKHVEYRVRQKDGTWKYFETIVTGLCDDTGSSSILAYSRDITRRKSDEAEIKKLNEELETRVRERTADLERAYEELRELDQLKDSFLSTVSHEFRTPLTAIRSFSEILLEYDGVEGKTRKEFLEIINAESERLTRLVNDVLDLSRIKAGKMIWQDAPLSLDEIIRNVAMAQMRLLEEKSLRLTLVIAPDLPRALADRDKIQQVLTNLVGNAVKFSRPSGEIRIRAAVFEGKRLGESPQWIRVSVSDEGIGIEEKHFQIIFDHFRQITADTLTDKPKGSGLGLPICKEIIHHYGGNIWVESVKGKGSTFHFTLPAAAGAARLPSEVPEALAANE